MGYHTEEKEDLDWDGWGSRRLTQGFVGPAAPTEETHVGESRERWSMGSLAHRFGFYLKGNCLVLGSAWYERPIVLATALA